jgi:hypothetical protein
MPLTTPLDETDAMAVLADVHVPEPPLESVSRNVIVPPVQTEDSPFSVPANGVLLIVIG